MHVHWLYHTLQALSLSTQCKLACKPIWYSSNHKNTAYNWKKQGRIPNNTNLGLLHSECCVINFVLSSWEFTVSSISLSCLISSSFSWNRLFVSSLSCFISSSFSRSRLSVLSFNFIISSSLFFCRFLSCFISPSFCTSLYLLSLAICLNFCNSS